MTFSLLYSVSKLRPTKAKRRNDIASSTLNVEMLRRIVFSLSGIFKYAQNDIFKKSCKASIKLI